MREENHADSESEEQAEKSQALAQTGFALFLRSRAVRRAPVGDDSRVTRRGFRVVGGVTVIGRHERDTAGEVSGRVVFAVRPEPMHGEQPGEYEQKEEWEMWRAPESAASEFPSHVM